MRRHIVPMFAANLVAFASIGVSYLVYSRLLTAAQFAAYAAALAVGNLFVLILDGGVRTAIIKHADELHPRDQSTLLTLMLCFSLLLLIILYAAQTALTHFYPALQNQSIFISSFAAVFLLTYPWIVMSTAAMERTLQYSSIAWIESIATVIERGSPAIFLMTSQFGLGAFVAGLVLGRITRLLLLRRIHSVQWKWRVSGDYKTIRALLGEGLALQIGGAASIFRDNAHVFIVGPMFGATWVGYYAWGFQLCTIASQAFVGIAARVSLPITAKAGAFADRWQIISSQIALLTASTAPILAVLLLVAPAMNHLLFKDKWLMALTILPLLCARMIPGIACTPIGTLLLVEKGAAKYATALWIWTAIELLAAFAAVKSFGPKGMAISYALTPWVGLFIFVRFFDLGSGALFNYVCLLIARRPAFLVFAVIAAATIAYNALSVAGPSTVSIVIAAALALSTLIMDPMVRMVLGRRQSELKN